MKTKTPIGTPVSHSSAPVQTPAMRDSLPPGAQTMADICAGPTAPGGMNAEQCTELLARLKEVSDAVDSVLKRGDSVRAALLALFQTGPDDLADVLLAPSMSMHDPAWVRKVKLTQKLKHAQVLVDDVLAGVFTSLDEWPCEILKDAIASLEGTG